MQPFNSDHVQKTQYTPECSMESGPVLWKSKLLSKPSRLGLDVGLPSWNSVFAVFTCIFLGGSPSQYIYIYILMQYYTYIYIYIYSYIYANIYHLFIYKSKKIYQHFVAAFQLDFEKRSWCMAMTRAWYCLPMLLASRWEAGTGISGIPWRIHGTTGIFTYMNG